MTTRQVAPDLFAEREGVAHLLGSTCPHCRATTFPQQSGCPRCTRREMQPVELPRVGVLWSFTVQAFRPKTPYDGPDEFVPYGVGYVDLDGRVLVESRLTENDPARLRIGQPVELVLEPYRQDEDGTDVLTFAFAPRADETP